MSKADAIRELARSGKSPRAIAEELGVSRQRVYQVIKAEGIKLPRQKLGPRAFSRSRPNNAPRAHILTGGIPVAVSTAVAGSVSELLVAADLLARGYVVFAPVARSSQSHDLIAVPKRHPTTLLTIEVRSAYRNPAGRAIFARKPECVSNHHAFVITGEPVVYKPPIPPLED